MRRIGLMASAAAVAAVTMLATGPRVDAAAGFSLDDLNLATTEDLFDVCTVENGDSSYFEAQAFCYGYFEGAAHLHDALASGPDYPKVICVEHDVTLRDGVAVFVNYARAHPEHMSELPMETVFRALIEQWPCA